jgi:hypothetical protein
MTAYIAHDANQARLTDMHRLADANRRVKQAVSQLEEMVQPANRQISIHAATEADRPAIERLAALDSAAVPAGEMLIAQVAGEPVAAIEVATGATVADPFRRTADPVELLAARARHLLEAEATTRRRFPRLRSAYRAA